MGAPVACFYAFVQLATVLASACATLTLFVYSIVKLYLKGLFGITLHASLYAGIQVFTVLRLAFVVCTPVADMFWLLSL
jgi:hypothetical protein